MKVLWPFGVARRGEGYCESLFRTAGGALPAEVTREWRFPAHRSASVHAATIPPPRGVTGIALLAELL
jgi:hypothetical protein